MFCALKPLTLTVITALLSLFSVAASAKTQRGGDFWTLGTFHSPKGFGICTEQFRSGSRDAFLVLADMNEIWDEQTSSPGYIFSYIHEMDFLTGKLPFSEKYNVFAGLGATFGYINDQTPIKGLMSGISMAIGSRLVLSQHFCMTLEFQADLAFHLKHDAVDNSEYFSFYKNGIFRCYLPQLKISYKF